MLIFFINILLLLQIVQSAIESPNQLLPNNESSIIDPTQKPVYIIGIVFPEAKTVRLSDLNLSNMIVTSAMAIEIAAESIKINNIIPGTLRIKGGIKEKEIELFIYILSLFFFFRRRLEVCTLLFRF